MVLFLFSLSSLLAVSCEAHEQPGFGSFAPPQWLVTVQAPVLEESSGLVHARTRPGVWFTHNDSGGEVELYAFDLQGRFLGAHPVPGATNRDWEDLAAGPCPAGGDADGEPCIYIGDIGDNKRSYDTISVYAVVEPAEGQPAPVVARWEVRYPAERHNAETLLVHPLTGRCYLVTKEKDGESLVFRFPESPGDGIGTLQEVARVRFQGPEKSDRKVTSGDWSTDGRRLVLRTYNYALEWQTSPEDPEAHWGQAPTRVELAHESQGESIAYSPEGHLVTTSEGLPMQVSIVRRRSAE